LKVFASPMHQKEEC